MKKLIKEGDHVFYKKGQVFCRVLEVDVEEETVRVAYTLNPFTRPQGVVETLALEDLAKFDNFTPKAQPKVKSTKGKRKTAKVTKKTSTKVNEAQALDALALLGD
jgi:hypothetical protein